MSGRPLDEITVPAGPAPGAPSAPLLATVEHVVVRPGDKLIVRVPRETAMDELDLLQAEFTRRMPDVPVVIVPVEEMQVFRLRETPASAP